MAYETMIGNKNAEKWTIETATELLNKAVDLSRSSKYDFIGEIAFDLKTDKSTFNYLKDKFPELEPLVKLMKNNCEVNCYRNTKNDKINTAAGIINLKSNHNWTDRQAVDQKQSITIEGLPSELDELLDDDEA